MLAEERDKYVDLRRAASQSVVELLAEAQLLENQTEIQRNAAVNRDRSEVEPKKPSRLCQRYNNSRPGAVKYGSSSSTRPAFITSFFTPSNSFLLSHI